MRIKQLLHTYQNVKRCLNCVTVMRHAKSIKYKIKVDQFENKFKNIAFNPYNIKTYDQLNII